MKRAILLMAVLFVTFACKNSDLPESEIVEIEEKEPEIIEEFGYNLNNYLVVRDTVKKGETFGEILYRNHIDHPEIHAITENVKDTFDIRKILVGKPYTILAKKDTTERAQIFIYQPNKVEYLIVDFTDSIRTTYGRKEIKSVVKSASGVITSSLSEAIDAQGLNYSIAHEMSDIYAWSIDFFHLQKGDKFKLIYEEHYIDDTVSVGIGKIKAAYFEHKNTPFYAFNYVTDSVKNTNDYYDEKAKTLRRQFLQAPLKFSRISSRYNPNRRIKYYGYKLKPHLGTDFAAPVGTPILSTANGTVIASQYQKANGNYVKVQHNSTYTTQYLHMSKRVVKVGQHVRQGDVIGYVGMTGNTSGPHVCYRFWKNGKQVDPLREKLPSAEPIKPEHKDNYLAFIQTLKVNLDQIPVKSTELALSNE